MKNTTASTITEEQPLTATQRKLSEDYIPLVKSIVAKFRNHLPNGLDLDDVYSIGIYGLMVAIRHYDESKGTAFGAYAGLRIRGAILDEFRRLDWMPRKLRAEARRIQQVSGQLEQEFGRQANDEEMSDALGMELYDYRTLKEKTRPVSVVHLDEAVNEGDEKGPNLQSIITDLTQLNAREHTEEQETIERIRRAIVDLPDMSKKVVAMYYYENMRLSEIAAVFGLSESRICQIHSKAVQEIRSVLLKVA